MLTNYHTHTHRCGHAGTYTDEAFVLSAVKHGYQVLGFSDHTPWPYESGWHNAGVRMHISSLPEYLSSIEKLKRKFAGIIKIYTGLECEYFPAYFDWLRQIRPQLDYLILGNHFSPSDEHGELYYSRTTCASDMDDYFGYTIAAIESGLFSCVAHPDHVMSDYPVFDHHCIDGSYALCHAAKAMNVPLEYNLLGIEKSIGGTQKGIGFPNRQFWEIAAEVGCSVIIGVDAHRPDQLDTTNTLPSVRKLLDQLGFSVLDTLPGCSP